MHVRVHQEYIYKREFVFSLVIAPLDNWRFRQRTGLKMSATSGRAIVLVSLCYLCCFRVVAQEGEGG